MAYVYLLIAIISEVWGTIFLKEIDGWHSWYPVGASITGFGLSLYFFSLSFKTIPMNIAYALWSSVGTLLMIGISIFIWNEKINMGTFIGILFILTGICILQFYRPKNSHSHT